MSPKVAKQWERGVVLRLGRYIGLRGPGLFWIVPLVDDVARWVDQRVITTSFAAEQTLTSDTVPVNVDAVLFWMVYDPEKAALEVQDYRQAVSWAAQTALRDIIGRTALTDLLRGRERIEAELQAHRRTDDAVGCDRAIGRDARRRDSGGAAGRDVARGASVA
jgi:regulator of protease activity HflC (stomatin/prohibitin superfamily)